MKHKSVGVLGLAVCAMALLFMGTIVFASGDESPPGISRAIEPDACSESDSIVYVSNATGSADLWLLDNVTGHSEPLLSWPDSVERSPDWNASCDRIVFASTRGATDDGWHIWTVAPDGSDPQQLTSGAGRHRFPRWSPDNNRILFSGDQDGSHGLWVMSADGTGQERIFQNLASPAVHGSWSPDGGSVAFVRCEAFCQVYRLVIGDTTPQQLTFSEDDKLGTDWGPNGILFTAVVNGQRVVASVDATGSEPVQVTFPGPGSTDFDPRWNSLDGGVIMVRVESDVYGVWSRTSLGEETRVGPALVVVPGVTGLAQANAEAAIIAAGLTVGAITTANSSTVPAGSVISQIPAAGTNVAPGVPVDLKVSLGGALVAVPPLTGLAQDEAQAAILAAGLTVGNVTTANSGTVPAGNVISQNPAAGANVAPGSPVDLVVSLGPANEPPDCGAAVPSVSVIWPPNHQFVPVQVQGVTDPEGPVSIGIDSIRQDEPTDTKGDGSFCPDGNGIGTATAQVRAERAGTKQVPGDGRVYHIGFTATDGAGARCTGTVRVCVPHDQGQQGACVDGGPLHDSTDCQSR